MRYICSFFYKHLNQQINMKLLTKKSLFFALIALFTLASCETNEVTNLKISKSAISIYIGQADSLVVDVTLTGELNELPISIKSSNPDVVITTESDKENISKSGKSSSYSKTIVFTALKTGTTTITLQAGTQTASCEVTVVQQSFTFSQAFAANWGDYYETGNNSFDLYLLENSLGISDSGIFTGTGTYLYIDFHVPITQNTINAGSFLLSATGNINTFFPGELIEYQDEFYPIGTRFVKRDESGITTALVTGGDFTITAKGANFLLEGDFTTENNEVIHFSYEGPLNVSDQREEPVEIFPALTKGELVYFGDAYNSKTTNNFSAYLASESVNPGDSVLNGEMLVLEFNTDITVTDSIPDGTYNMMTELTYGNLIPYSLVFGYTTTEGYEYGTWYYSTTTTKKIKTGNIVVSKNGNIYTVNYNLFDRFGSKVSGTFTGPLTYIDGTAETPSSVSAARIKSNKQTTKSFSTIQQNTKKIKSLKIRQ
jgi:hypothetical protein